MKTVIGCATIFFTPAIITSFLTLATITSADAKGCIKAALVGGTAGHFAGHHTDIMEYLEQRRVP
jgi:hypothetical protein